MVIVGWILIGLAVLLLFRAIANPKSRKTGRGWGIARRIGGLIGALVIAFVGLIFLAVSMDEAPSAQVDAATASSAALQTEISQPRAAEVEATTETEPDWVDSGTPLQIGPTWQIWAGWEGQDVVFRQQLGNEFLGDTADSGYRYALVPVAVKNNTQRTESLSFASWELRDDQNYEYTIETLADMYLSEEAQLDVTNVPPGSTRSGFLVFQVRDNVNELYLSLSTVRSGGTWRFVLAN